MAYNNKKVEGIKMKNITKILAIIAIIILILVGAIYYFLTPSEKLDLSSTNKENRVVTTEDLLKGASIDTFKVLNNPLRLEGKINVSDETVQNLVYTIMKKSDMENVEYSDIQVVKNRIKIVSPYKVLGFIDSQYELYLDLGVEKDNLVATLNDFKIGKIKVSNTIIKNVLKKYKSTSGLKVEGNKFIVDKSNIYPMLVKKVDVKDNIVILNVEVEAENVMEFLKNSKIGVIG
ncbi:hypothetical protein SAMN04488530_10369 [Asaccharospora irregularis DSM 2635]|uniref:Uncharacterized protein n=2 Tax=Asaccharospora TaxID=1505660 RepID=A0A1M5KQ37_9FIRM|nr:hypothetical protein SAMN04488530_10369 [Asaccharospora irregularis DSM 2635]